MANATVNVSFDITNYVKASDPYTVFKTNTSSSYQVSEQHELYGTLQPMPQNLRHNVLIGWTITAACWMGTMNYGRGISIHITDDFDTNTLVWNNKPSRGDNLGGLYNEDSQTGRGTGSWANVTSYYATTGLERLPNAFNKKKICLYSNASGGSSSEYQAMTRVLLYNSSTKPYFIITYDNATKITSKVSYSNSQLTGTINPAVSKSLTWELVKDPNSISGYCIDETWAQASAVFKYRVAGESTWQTISVTGTTKGVTIPAYTFTSDTSYEYQITVTDEDNTTTSTDVYAFTAARSQVTAQNSPTSGYVNPRNATTFSWYYANSLGTVGAGVTTFHWKDSAGAWGDHDIPLEAGVTTITIPANTFSVADTIKWYLSGYDVTGQYSQTSVYSFSTAAAAVTATSLEPADTIVSNNQEVQVSWRFSSSDGFPPSRYILQYKLITASEWTELVDSTTIATSYTAAAYTFPAGEIQWRVIPYNIDDVIGTSVGASFISYGAPAEPVVYATETPFMTVTWQADDQQAYEIVVGSKTYGPYFGAEKSFDVPDYLEDGQYTVRVRVVGGYGLWSDWGSTAASIENAPGEDITLTGTEGVSNLLSWETEEATADFLVYRDGVQIGHTYNTQFEDRLTSGEHVYKVINKLPDDNYSESNEITLQTAFDGVYIAPYIGGDWVKIDYSLKNNSNPNYSESVQSFYNHLAGNEYPSAILSIYHETTVGYSAVFFYNQEELHEQFKAMFGKPVILKFKDGSVIVGILDSWTRQPKKQYYTAYTFTIHRIEWEDYVDDTDSGNTV